MPSRHQLADTRTPHERATSTVAWAGADQVPLLFDFHHRNAATRRDAVPGRERGLHALGQAGCAWTDTQT